MTNQFNQLQEKRRSIYALGKNVKEDKRTLVDLIEKTIELSPSAFNSQTVRAVIAFGQDSDRIWDIVLAELCKVVKDDEAFAKTQAKVNSFKAYGTILYFTETATVKQLEADFPAYAANFAGWAEQAIGGAQQAVWEALAVQGLGASLQHYNPLIDEAIAKAFDIPETWQLRAEMPFGSVEAPAGEKDVLPAEKRFKVFGV